MEPRLATRDSEAIACAQYYERGRVRGVGKKERREKKEKEEKAKRARAVAQLMGVLSGMCEALGSVPSTKQLGVEVPVLPSLRRLRQLAWAT